MASPRERASTDAPSRSSVEKTNIEHVERADESGLAFDILQRYPLLIDKSEEERATLNKKVLRKLDWKFLVCLPFFEDTMPLANNLTSHASPSCFS